MDDLFPFLSQPGVRRDGTETDSDYYNDGVWVRWQRGKPRKIGGYRNMTSLANGPVRSLLVDSRNGANSVHSFSPWGIQRLAFSSAGAGGSAQDRTPIGFVPDSRLTWSQGIMTSSTGGKYSALLASSAPDVLQIDSDEAGTLYTGDMSTTTPLTVVSDSVAPIQVSGGVCVLQPFAVVYGSNGNLRNCNPNDFSNSVTQGWTVGGSSFANNANVAGTKFIHGAPVRGGSQSPAGLFWALDALVRMSFVGGTAIWQYDTLSQPTSVLCKKGIVEHDGKFFWPGTDRFLFYNGVVQELPNQMNCNWFFDNLNFAQRNKVWGTKIPRFGEIWWFYPRGDATECTDAIIFNYIENTWYDAHKSRSAGGQVQIFPYPVWSGSEDDQVTTLLTIGTMSLTSAGTASGNAVLNFASTTSVVDGQAIWGAGVPTGATVASHTGTTVTMSAVSTAIIPTATPITFTSMSASPFVQNDLVTGVISTATGTVARSSLTQLNLKNVTGTFTATETLSGPHSALAKSQAAVQSQLLSTIYQQEFGWDKITGDGVTAIPASFTSKQFGFAIGNPFGDQAKTNDVMTRVTRLELDFQQTGDLTIELEGRSFPNNPQKLLETLTAGVNDSFVEFREQERILQLTISTNTQGGFFEQGLVNIKLEPGDERSSEDS